MAAQCRLLSCARPQIWNQTDFEQVGARRESWAAELTGPRPARPFSCCTSTQTPSCSRVCPGSLRYRVAPGPGAVHARASLTRRPQRGVITVGAVPDMLPPVRARIPRGVRRDSGAQDKLQSGVLLIRPSRFIFAEMAEAIRTRRLGSYDGGDQGALAGSTVRSVCGASASLCAVPCRLPQRLLHRLVPHAKQRSVSGRVQRAADAGLLHTAPCTNCRSPGHAGSAGPPLPASLGRVARRPQDPHSPLQRRPRHVRHALVCATPARSDSERPVSVQEAVDWRQA
jgi:hypothetical protein